MRRVYQRHPGLAAALAAALAACDGAPAPRSGLPATGTALSPAEASLILETRSFALATHGPVAGDEWLATEQAPGGRRAVYLSPLTPGARRGVTPGERDCRALTALPGGGALVDCSGATHREIWAHRPGSGAQRLTAVDGDAEALLAVSDAPPTLWTASAPSGERPARLIATSVATLARRSLFSAPPGYEIVAVEPASTVAVLRREVTPEAHEVLLHDWRSRDSRLLLPTAEDGRFGGIQFVDGGRAILLLADDGRNAPRLEKLLLESGVRQVWGDLRCPPTGVQPQPDGTVTVELLCESRREAERLDASGAAVDPPALPSGVRLVDARAAPTGGRLAVVTTGERWPTEIAVAESGDVRPLTYSLPPRLRSQSLPSPRRIPLPSGGLDLPAELWSAVGAPPRAIAIWFESDLAPLRFGEFRPAAAALAARGVATLVVRGRGGELPSRRFRRAADGDPSAAAIADLRAAAATAIASAPPGAPRLLIGEGPRWGAAALALAAAADCPFAAVAAIDPDLDPLAEAAAIESSEEPLRSFLLTRWSQVDAATVDERRARWSDSAARSTVPTWVAIDSSRVGATETVSRWRSEPTSGVPRTIVELPAGADADRLPTPFSGELHRFLLAAAAPPR